MMTAPFVTSVRVERSSGPHEYVSVWIRGQSVGTLCVGKGDGDALHALLMPEPFIHQRGTATLADGSVIHLVTASEARVTDLEDQLRHAQGMLRAYEMIEQEPKGV